MCDGRCVGPTDMRKPDRCTPRRLLVLRSHSLPPSLAVARGACLVLTPRCCCRAVCVLLCVLLCPPTKLEPKQPTGRNVLSRHMTHAHRQKRARRVVPTRETGCARHERRLSLVLSLPLILLRRVVPTVYIYPPPFLLCVLLCPQRNGGKGNQQLGYVLCRHIMHAEYVVHQQTYEDSRIRQGAQRTVPLVRLGAHGMMSGGCPSLSSSHSCCAAWCLPRTYYASMLLRPVLLCLQRSGCIECTGCVVIALGVEVTTRNCCLGMQTRSHNSVHTRAVEHVREPSERLTIHDTGCARHERWLFCWTVAC